MMSVLAVLTTPEVLISSLSSSLRPAVPVQHSFSGLLTNLNSHEVASVLRLSRRVSAAVPRGMLARWIEAMQEVLVAGGLNGLVCVLGNFSRNCLSDSQPVAAMEWSPSGLHLAVGNDTGHFCIHTPEAQDGNKRKLVMHHGRVAYMAWNPSGNAVATSCSTDDLALRVIDAKSGSVSVTAHHSLSPAAIGWNLSGTCIATVCERRSFLANSPDSILYLTDAITGVMTELEHGSPIMSLAFNPAADQIATGTMSGCLRIFDVLQMPCRLVEPLAQFSGKLRPIAWDPSGKLLAVAICTPEAQSQLVVFDGATGSIRYRISYEHKISELQWGPDEEHLATTSHGTVHVLHAQNGHVKHVVDSGPSSPLQAVWCPTGESLALFGIGSAGVQVIQILALKTGVIRSLSYVGEPVLGMFSISLLSWSPSGHSLALISCAYTNNTNNNDEVIAIIDAATGHVRRQIKQTDAQFLAWRP